VPEEGATDGEAHAASLLPALYRPSNEPSGDDGRLSAGGEIEPAQHSGRRLEGSGGSLDSDTSLTAQVTVLTPDRPASEAAFRVEHLPGDPLSVVGAQPGDETDGVVGLAPTALRSNPSDRFRQDPTRCQWGRG